MNKIISFKIRDLILLILVLVKAAIEMMALEVLIILILNPLTVWDKEIPHSEVPINKMKAAIKIAVAKIIPAFLSIQINKKLILMFSIYLNKKN